MSQIFEESNLRIDFSKAKNAEWFEDPNTHRASSFKKVDFLVEQGDNLWFIEVKGGKHKNIKKERESIRFKAKDSLLYLFLTNRYDDTKRTKYFVILDPIDRIYDSAILTTQSDRLKQQLGITNPPWSSRPYFKEALVFNVTTWNKFFPQFPVSRISTG